MGVQWGPVSLRKKNRISTAGRGKGFVKIRMLFADKEQCAVIRTSKKVVGALSC